MTSRFPHTVPSGTALGVTGSSPAEVAEIRGLGYIGLMATGAHHRRHHWMIATGRAPHGG